MSFETDITNALKDNSALRKLNTFAISGGAYIYQVNDSPNYGEKHETQPLVNLSSNDYLGITAKINLQQEFLESLPLDQFILSSPSSRLMCGNNKYYDDLEQFIAQLYNTSGALVLGNGYALNSSLPRAITDKNSIILADKLIHSSLTDGIQLAPCKWERFKHNDLEQLEKLLLKHQGKRIVVIIESLYSMDGDLADNEAIKRLKNKYKFELVVDEAHAFGVFGDKGKGLFDDNTPDYRIVTLGKAAASYGAFVVCTKERKELLVNKLKSLIYSTALPPIQIMWSRFIIEKITMMDSEREHLQSLIRIVGGASQITPIMAWSNERALELQTNLLNEGFHTTAIRYPTVAIGTERIRISLTAAHTAKQIEKLCTIIG